MKKETDLPFPVHLLAFACAIARPFLWVAVSEDLWSWYVVPLGAPTLNWAALWGLALVAICLRPGRTHIFKDDVLIDNHAASAAFGNLLALLAMWGIGALLRSYIVIGVPA